MRIKFSSYKPYKHTKLKFRNMKEGTSIQYKCSFKMMREPYNMTPIAVAPLILLDLIPKLSKINRTKFCHQITSQNPKLQKDIYEDINAISGISKITTT